MTAKSAIDTTDSPSIRSLIPARIDRLPWSRFHTRLVTALGIAWILDGLEITIASNVGSDLTLKSTLNMSAGAVSDIAWWYLIGSGLTRRRRPAGTGSSSSTVPGCWRAWGSAASTPRSTRPSTR
jgi:hypothetical protein